MNLNLCHFEQIKKPNLLKEQKGLKCNSTGMCIESKLRFFKTKSEISAFKKQNIFFLNKKIKNQIIQVKNQFFFNSTIFWPNFRLNCFSQSVALVEGQQSFPAPNAPSPQAAGNGRVLALPEGQQSATKKKINYNLENFLRSNQDTCLTHKPTVFEGSWVQSGDLLADCASSVGGELSLGQNLLIAYMPWEGYNFEDAILISERLVMDDLYTSVHIERYELEIQPTKLGLEQITRNIPDLLEKEFNKLDSFGIIKIGTWVKEGDILIGKITPINKKNISPYQKLLATILGKPLKTFKDSSLRAPKGIEAKVIDIKYFCHSPIVKFKSLPQNDAINQSKNSQLNFKKTRCALAAGGTPFGGQPVNKKNRSFNQPKIQSTADGRTGSRLNFPVRWNYFYFLKQSEAFLADGASPCTQPEGLTKTLGGSGWTKKFLSKASVDPSAMVSWGYKLLTEIPVSLIELKKITFASDLKRLCKAKTFQHRQKDQFKLKKKFGRFADSARPDQENEFQNLHNFSKTTNLNENNIWNQLCEVDRPPEGGQPESPNSWSKKKSKNQFFLNYFNWQPPFGGQPKSMLFSSAPLRLPPFGGLPRLKFLKDYFFAAPLRGAARRGAKKKHKNSIDAGGKQWLVASGTAFGQGRALRESPAPLRGADASSLAFGQSNARPFGCCPLPFGEGAYRHGFLTKKNLLILLKNKLSNFDVLPVKLENLLRKPGTSAPAPGQEMLSVVASTEQFVAPRRVSALDSQSKASKLKHSKNEQGNRVAAAPLRGAGKATHSKTFFDNKIQNFLKQSKNFFILGKLKIHSTWSLASREATTELLSSDNNSIFKKNVIVNQIYLTSYPLLKPAFKFFSKFLNSDCEVDAASRYPERVRKKCFFKCPVFKVKIILNKSFSRSQLAVSPLPFGEGATAPGKIGLLRSQKLALPLGSWTQSNPSPQAAGLRKAMQNQDETPQQSLSKNLKFSLVQSAKQSGTLPIKKQKTHYRPPKGGQQNSHSLNVQSFSKILKHKKNSKKNNKKLTVSTLIQQKLESIHLYLAEKRHIQVGDKMSGRHGNKGIVSQILPRQDMPYLPDGTPIDMVLNPLGVPSRMNVGQIYECLLGLAGKYLGEHFKVFAFDEMYGPEASRSLVFNKLYEASLKTGMNWLFNPNTPGKVRLYDGRTGECFHQNVTVGQAYILKLVHMVDDKIHSRSTGPYSLITQQPLRGRSKQGGQRLGEMEVWALEGYGAAFTLLEMLTIKSDDMTGRMTLWSNLILNKEISIGTPEAFKVLICELQALCLDIGLYRFRKPSSQVHFNSKMTSLVEIDKLLNLP